MPYPIEDTERCVNLYPENIEVNGGKSKMALINTPGLSLLCTLPDVGHRAAIYYASRLFVVSGATLYEIYVDGTFVSRGTVVNDTLQASMAVNGIGQMCVISGLQGYIFDTRDNSFVQIMSDGFLGARQVVMVDGYFACAKPQSNTWFISGLNDGINWDALDFANTEGETGNIVSIVASFREIWCMCDTHCEVYIDSGGADFPFSRTGGGYLEKGSTSIFAPALIDNSIFWVSRDYSGADIVMRSNGYQGVRVSNHAIEWIINKWQIKNNFIGMAYEIGGHSFYILMLGVTSGDPNPRTLVYDVSTGMWHEWAWWTGTDFTRARANTCVWAFGTRWCGDWESGKFYQITEEVYTDDGNPIVRQRISPHVCNEMNQLVVSKVRLDCQTGVGLTNPAAQGYDPQVTLEVSRDGGRTYGNQLQVSIGKVGEYNRVAEFRRLGVGRDFVFKMTFSDPVPFAIANAYIEYQNGR